MKINKITNLFIASLVLMFASCEPIVDQEYLTNTTDVAGVELSIVQTTPGGNELIVSVVTPGITGYWEYALGKELTTGFTVVYPIPGTSTFTFKGTLGAEFFEKSIDVQIDVLDHPLNQDWYDLVGTDTTAGKTWVFDGTGGDGGLWWFMSPPDSKDGAWTAWWNAGGTCCPPSDVNGRMHFDLDGAANYTYYADANAEGVKGSFELNVPNQVLKISGSNILGSEEPRGNPAGIYEIVSLTEDQMVLYVPTNAGNTGWTWVFKPEE